MHNNLCITAPYHTLKEGLDLGDVLWRIVHLTKAVADLVAKEVRALFDAERLDQGIDGFNILE